MNILPFGVLTLLAGFAALTLAQPAAQPGINTAAPLDPQPNSPRTRDPAVHLLIGATIHIKPGLTIDQGAILIRDNRIERVVNTALLELNKPAGAQVHDLTGMHIYAGFIDAHLPIDTPRPDLDAPGTHWNASVTPRRSALDAGSIPDAEAEALRSLGFTTAAIAPKGGIFAGRAAVVSLAPPSADPADGKPPVYATDVYQALSFQRAGSNRGEFDTYPTSLMGAIALIRQTLSDAEWPHINSNSLTIDLPLLFRTRDELEGLRASKIANEFGYPFIILGSGTEFRRLDAIAQNHTPDQSPPTYILPLTFPKTPDLDTIGKADSTNLRTLMTWEQAPTNPRRLDDAGVTLCLTASGLRKGEKFLDNLRDALALGSLPPDRALAMLTTSPATLLGVESDLGTIEPNKIANLVITSSDLFTPSPGLQSGDDPKILDIWIDGTRYTINAPPPPFDGTWTLRIGDAFEMTLIIDGNTITGIEGEGDEASEGPARKVTIKDTTISFLLDDTDDGTGTYILSGILTPDGTMHGTGLGADNTPFEWTATKTEPEAQARSAEEFPDLSRVEGVYELNGCGIDCFNPWLMVHPDWGVRFLDDICQNPVWDNGIQSDTVEVHDALLTAIFTLASPLKKGERVQVTVTIDTSDDQNAVATIAADPALYVFCGLEQGKLTGSVQVPTARQPLTDLVTDEDNDLPPETLPGYPFGPYALDTLPPQHTIIFHNATIWTSGPDGIIDNGWVCIEEGKIIAVREGSVIDIMTKHDPVMIDLHGKHLTPGLIDAHSHTGISRGVNESGQAVTAEVRIGDVTNPDSINWYRQLAGGVTTVNSMHGSANPIGGQTQTNKVRWGAVHPDDMHMQDAKPGIKFALGENVKRSNWENDRNRYPQTRMGVETLIRDRFIAAREYAALQYPFGQTKRIDLELEALAEILAGERLVHCHSYRQDEILMLCRIAEEFGFTIGTFQHGLEVYKVAEAVKENAIGASLFSDWWAYKVEVQDAIAQAGPLQTEVGVLTSYNSDSDELSRRMNVEAAKAYKYSDGRLSKEDALKFVTINPAIQLGIDSRVGSIEVGKEADLAIWSGEPLSSFSKCEATYIDGREYFSLARDADLRTQNAAHRTRITQKILTKGAPEPKTESDADAEQREASDDPPHSPRAQATARTIYYLDLYLRGINPADHRCGDCGNTELQLGGNQ